MLSMGESNANPKPLPNTYRYATHHPMNCLLFILPLLVFFQVGTAYYGTGLLAPQDLGRILKYFGATAPYLPAMLIVVVLLLQHISQRQSWHAEPKVFLGMFAESIIWMLPLVGLSFLSSRYPAWAVKLSPQNEQFLQQILVGVGAGIYEEFLFRLVFITLVMLLLVDVFGLKKEPVAIAGVLAGAVLFSLYHFSGGQLDQYPSFPWREFVFRAFAGLYLGWVFVFRGFAVAVGAHAFYDIYVVIASMS
jgi:hypothetical protein